MPEKWEEAMGKAPEDDNRPLADMLIPHRLRRAIDAAGLNQSELSRRTGISREAVSRYCTGRTPLPGPKLIMIADALGVQPSSIDPGRAALDVIPPRNDDDPEFIIRPVADASKPGMVRLEIAADIDIELAAHIVALMTGKTPHK
ncbi:MAG: helix-turn-helix domain-containing protein [Pseudodonghicola sp.]